MTSWHASIRTRRTAIQRFTALTIQRDGAKGQSARAGGCVRLGDSEREFAFRPGHVHDIASLHVSAKQLFRERIFQVSLDRPTHRARAILRVVPFLDQKLFGSWLEF